MGWRPFWAVVFFLCQLAPAQADLSLFPTRLVLEKNQRAAQIELMNNSSQAQTYRISLVNRRMTESGEIVEAREAQEGERFADELIRFSPRQVTITPGGSQVVRVLVRKPSGLADGEYRSHLQFDRLPDATASSLEALTGSTGQEIGVVITTLIGASIPVIVRHGDTQASTTLADLVLEGDTGKSLLAFKIRREGNRSVYGDLSVTFTPKGGKELEVGRSRGVAVYVPNGFRFVRLPLSLPEGLNLASGTLTLQLRDRPEAGGRVMAQASLQLP